MKEKTYALKSEKSGYLFIAPALALMLVFIVYSLLSSLRISFSDWSGLGALNYIGLGNYTELMRDSVFWNSIKVTFIWVALSVVILAASGMLLALVVEYFVPFRSLTSTFRTVLFMPMMMSTVAISLMWTLIFNPTMGLLNELLRTFGLISKYQTVDLLGNYDWAIYVTFIPVIWQWSGFGMVIFSAAMQGVPGEIMEAAIVDGCNKSGQIRHIVLPLLMPTVAMVCTLNLIGGFKCFDIIYVMTAGGPGTSTQVTSIYIFKQAFVNNHYGYSAAISCILFLVTTAFGLIFFQSTKRLDNYV